MRRFYVAVIEHGEVPGYGVTFPDLPGCTSAGDTIADAAENAIEAASLYIEQLSEMGTPIPQPGNPDQHSQDVAPENEAARILVPVDIPSKAQRVHATIDESLVAQLDARAHQQGLTRSGAIAEAVRLWMRSDSGGRPPQKRRA